MSKFGLWIVIIVATLFGLLTIKSGGSVLFVDGTDRLAAGHYVPFVLWFNFIAGFAYLFTAAGLFLQQKWAKNLSVIIAVATISVFALLGLHILNEGLYESRTVGAMTLRSMVWIAIAVYLIITDSKKQ